MGLSTRKYHQCPNPPDWPPGITPLDLWRPRRCSQTRSDPCAVLPPRIQGGKHRTATASRWEYPASVGKRKQSGSGVQPEYVTVRAVEHSSISTQDGITDRHRMCQPGTCRCTFALTQASRCDNGCKEDAPCLAGQDIGMSIAAEIQKSCMVGGGGGRVRVICRQQTSGQLCKALTGVYRSRPVLQVREASKDVE